MIRNKYWFPVGLLPFFILFVVAIYFSLQAFNPHIPINQIEQPKKSKAKKVFWHIIEKHLNPDQ